ncbi:MAG: DMT family transporter [Bacteroidetes bacterium]|nr:DMT family transporter [Bacteroidota bacterium]
MLMLWLASAIWGFAFVAQREGMKYIGPFTFNGIRFAIGSLSLIPLLWLLPKDETKAVIPGFSRLKGGLLAGVILFAGASLQQAGMIWTTAGKAGFITGLYVILVPFIGIFIGQVIGRNVWIGALLAVAGLFLLTINDHFTIDKGDFLVLLSAFFWAIHVQLINKLVTTLEPLRLAIIQFAVCAILSLFTAGLFETIQMNTIIQAIIPLLYGGLASVGIAYTLQVFAQRHVHPAIASIVLSFETVFAAIGGWLILNESLSIRSLAGCLMMLAGIWIVKVKRKSL